MLIDKTGWTLDYIFDLTPKQLNHIIHGFNSIQNVSQRGGGSGNGDLVEPTVDDLRMFNLASGIERKIIKKPSTPSSG